MGNICIKVEADDTPNIIIVGEIIDLNPIEFGLDYKINWDDKKKNLFIKLKFT